MKKILKPAILAVCLAILYPSAVFADTDGQSAPSFTPINSASDLNGAIPQSIVSISTQTAPNNVIFNYEGLTITLIGYYKQGEYLYMNLAVNNNTDTSYYINTINTSLNGLSCGSSSSITALPNKLSYEYVQFYTDYDTLRYLSMDEISDIKFSLQIVNENAYYDYYESYDYYSDYDSFTGYTTTAPIHFKDYGVTAKALDTGTVLYNANGIKIVKKDLFIRNYGPADLHLALYIENTSGETIYLDNDSSMINNYNVECSFSGVLETGQSGIAHLVIPASELSNLNIKQLSDIKKFEGTFSFYKGIDSSYAYYYYGYGDAERIKTTFINLLQFSLPAEIIKKVIIKLPIFLCSHITGYPQ